MAVDSRDGCDKKRKAVIILETEEDGISAGNLGTETVMVIRKDLATLYQQGVATEVVLIWPTTSRC